MSKQHRQHRGKRNLQKKLDHNTLFKQRKIERQIVYNTSYKDKEKPETVCTVTSDYIKQKICESLSENEPLMINDPTGFDGLVLVDRLEFLFWQTMILLPQHQGEF